LAADITIVDSLTHHAMDLAPAMRQADVDEIWDAWSVTPLRALLEGLDGDYCKSVLNSDGKCIAMFGATETPDPDLGVTWLLASDEFDRCCTRELLRQSKAIQRDMHRVTERRVLANFVSVDNHRSIRWLEWCGAKFEPPAPYGHHCKPFRFFTLTQED